VKHVVPLYETIESHREWASKEDARIQIGYPFFDSRTGGIALGEVCMFLARSGVGKTAWACNVAEMARRVPQVFFSLEMQGRFIASRIAAIHSNVPTRHIEWDLKNHGESSALDQLHRDFPFLTIVDTPGMSLRQMGEALDEAEIMWLGVKPRLIIIDYMELIKSAAMSAVEGLDGISRKLKDFARERDIAVVVLHQLNLSDAESGGWSPVRLRDARYGGPTAADYVLAGFRPSTKPGAYQDGLIQMQFLKTRTDGGLHASGVGHSFDDATLRIRPL